MMGKQKFFLSVYVALDIVAAALGRTNFPIMSGQVLRKAESDVSVEINKIEKDFENISTIDEVLMQAQCECCGLREECTRDYIERIKDSYAGKWVCGLCSEAVKEGLKRGSPVAIEEAVSSHRKFCQEFNSSTRLNPKLSFTMAMRSIARRSHENKEKKQYPTSKISRSSSCAPRIDLTMKQS
ncbi:uncharacterized protein LOC132069241 [Lycium ferocissimum]|uniref:uncharacterized protein LOC132069241 n=1 Tax=Lycium ferocissimum TaxID=112874 RepID=UPI0028152431|nr:uncharacterized protein LOC132069241 [Lycium ferocissimum]